MQRSGAATLVGVLLLGPESGSLALPLRCRRRAEQTYTSNVSQHFARPSGPSLLLQSYYLLQKHMCSL